MRTVVLLSALLTLPALASWGASWGEEGFHSSCSTPLQEDIGPQLDAILADCIAVEGAAMASACEDAICDGVDDGMTQRFGGGWGDQPVGIVDATAAQWCGF